MRGLAIFVKVNLVLVSLFVIGCSRNASPQSILSVSCDVSASATANSSSALISVACSGGTSPYSISNLLIGGQTPDSITGNQSGFSFSTNLTVTDNSMTNLQNVSGSLTVTDTSGASARSTFNILGNGDLFGSTACTLTASASATVNQSVTLTAVGNTTWGTAPFTFSNLVAGSNGSVTQALATTSTVQAQAIAVYSAAGSPAPSVSVMDSTGKTGTCSTSLVVTGASGSAPVCSISQNIGANNNVTIQAIANDGQALTISNLNAGANGTVFSAGNPTVLAYSVAGTKTVSFNANSTATGLACNGGAALTTTFYAPASTGTSSGMTCSIAQSTDSQGRVVFTATSSNGQALNFLNFNAGLNGSIVTQGNPLTVAYSTAGTKTISTQAYSTSTGLFCNGGAVWSQSFYANVSAAGAGLSCSYQLSADAANRLVVRLFSNTGETLQIINVNPGSGGSIYSSGNPTTIAYSTAGLKTISLQAYAPATGAWCGSGAPSTFSVNVQASTGGKIGRAHV